MSELDVLPTPPFRAAGRHDGLNCAAGQAACAWHTRYHLAFHDAPAPMSISTYADGRFIDVNTSFLRMIGFSRDELIGRTSQELRFWYDHAHRQELLRGLEASNGLLQFEAYPLRTKQGEQLWTDVCAQATEMDGIPCLLIIYNEHRLRQQKQRDVNKVPGPPPLCGRRRPKQRERVNQAELQSAIAEAVSVIERTRHAFKSKELAELRRRLQGVLKKVPDFGARVE